jgi:glutamate/tyrosine decarboxylase-like PLP-dependent enzyme
MAMPDALGCMVNGTNPGPDFPAIQAIVRSPDLCYLIVILGYAAMIGRNIALAWELFDLCRATSELEAWTRGLSITTFRYVPTDLEPSDPVAEEHLNALNRALVGRLQRGGELFLSNAVVRGTYLLRTYWVNFRTTGEDTRAIPGIVRRVGAELDREFRGPRPI